MSCAGKVVLKAWLRMLQVWDLVRRDVLLDVREGRDWDGWSLLGLPMETKEIVFAPATGWAACSGQLLYLDNLI